ncbi:hypothetical protein SAMN05444266_104479 [Chitinophaga jiangningensis]|uniref:Uncharacterized protein n=1 Tax=Chitinophaga jiangningensis TaxID=1419482 RepID=A0A1M7CTW7_9BACT|nr:hypothetical protein [Chitinophaga jiangningensis]SHL70778.1 hypothetical protein SAMN05444266_104479 [Chitinophaga jiangningensis]
MKVVLRTLVWMMIAVFFQSMEGKAAHLPEPSFYSRVDAHTAIPSEILTWAHTQIPLTAHTTVEPFQDVEFVAEESDEKQVAQGELPLLCLKLWYSIKELLLLQIDIRLTYCLQRETAPVSITSPPRYILHNQLLIPFGNS